MSPATRISEDEVKDLPKLEKGASDFGIFSIRFKATLRAAKKLYVIERETDVVRRTRRTPSKQSGRRRPRHVKTITTP